MATAELGCQFLARGLSLLLWQRGGGGADEPAENHPRRLSGDTPPSPPPTAPPAPTAGDSGVGWEEEVREELGGDC